MYRTAGDLFFGHIFILTQFMFFYNIFQDHPQIGRPLIGHCLEWYNKTMQKIATRIFIGASVVFGVTGILMILTLPPDGQDGTGVNMVFSRILFATVFVILPSFALSVASKYLNGKS